VAEDRFAVAGIALTQVPYTGFEAGPFLTALFYTVLGLWSVFVAYLLIIREEPVLGFTVNNSQASGTTEQEWEHLVEEMHEATVTEDIAAAAVAEPTIPANLPTGTFAPAAPVVGYANHSDTETTEQRADREANELENAAHTLGTLLSSDVIAHFMQSFTDPVARVEAMTAAVTEAKTKYPTEGGWLVLNLERLTALSPAVQAAVAETQPEITAANTEAEAGSLAEAMVTGNVMAAFAMLGERPMLALAEATTDLDNVLRARQGQSVPVSNLLKESTDTLSVEQLTAMIIAMTTALDGTYTDETAAVKMAIMKAAQVLG
jgi:hypothetical protein